MADQVKNVFIILYAMTKDKLPFQSCSKTGVIYLLRKIASIFIATLSLFVLAIFILPFALLRTGIGTVLRIMHGRLYGGLLSGLDAVFEMNANKTVINVILIYTSSEPTNAIEKMKKCILEIFQTSFKFGCIVKKALGFSYYLKNQIKCEDIIEVIRYNDEEYMSKDMLFDYLEKNCLTLTKKQLWRVTIFKQPLEWFDDNKRKNRQYAVVWTLRHCLGDGPSIISLFKKFTVTNCVEDNSIMQKIKIERPNINLDNVYVHRNPSTTPLDGTPLKIPGNSDWYIAYFIEPKIKYLPIIKKMKTNLNVTFTEVICAAFCKSIYSYAMQRKVELKNFTMGSIIRLKSEDLLKLQNGTYDFENITNNFGMLGINLPTDLDNRSMKSTIMYLHRYRKALYYAVDPIVAYEFLRSLCTFFPENLIRYFCKSFMECATLGVTNLVGVKDYSWCDQNVEDVFFFSPDFLKTGFTFNVIAYGDRLQILLTSRRGYVHSREELQQILNVSIDNLDKASEEILEK